MNYLTKLFWLDAGERAIKTVAQTLLSLWAVGEGLDLLNVNWEQALSVAGGAAVISLLMSIASSSTGETKSASLVVETTEEK